MREKGWGCRPPANLVLYAGCIRSDLWRTGDHVFPGGMCVWYECVYANARTDPRIGAAVCSCDGGTDRPGMEIPGRPSG